MTEIEDEKDDFSKVTVKTFHVFQHDVILKEDKTAEEGMNEKQEDKSGEED